MAVACLSLAYGVLGVAWLLGADWSVSDDPGAGLIAVLGFLGAPAALGHTQTSWSPSAYRPLLVFTAVQAVVFGLLAPGVIAGTRPLFAYGAFLLGCGWAVLGVRGLRAARHR